METNGDYKETKKRVTQDSETFKHLIPSSYNLFRSVFTHSHSFYIIIIIFKICFHLYPCCFIVFHLPPLVSIQIRIVSICFDSFLCIYMRFYPTNVLVSMYFRWVWVDLGLMIIFWMNLGRFWWIWLGLGEFVWVHVLV